MLTDIPIKFEYEGREYSGSFTQVSGGGSVASFHLMIDNFYRGQLNCTENFGWQFFSNKGDFENMSEYFGQYVMAWYQ